MSASSTLIVREVSAQGFRSLRNISFPVAQLTAFVGANGVGKTNLYRALQLLQSAATGTLAREVAAEGGMAAALWAEKRVPNKPVRLKLAVTLGVPYGSHEYIYSLELGLVKQDNLDGHCITYGAAFPREAQVKTERLTLRTGRRETVLMERNGPSGFIRDEEGRKQSFGVDLLASETSLSALQDAARYPDIFLIRRTMEQWRFYHGMRTDRDSPLRRPCPAITTPTLASDGADLAAVFATLAHIGEDTVDLDTAVADAFSGAQILIPKPEMEASFAMIFPDMPKRIFGASELSDGTLHFLALSGALNAYRLPPFIALNEPETSLHPDLMEPLAKMIARAAERTQIWLVTHSERLATALAQHAGIEPLTVIKRDGETWIDGLMLSGEFSENGDGGD